MKLFFNEFHLLQAMQERIGISNQQSISALEILKFAILKNTPDEWRFTRHPSGFFLICDISNGIKYFGVSYRFSPEDAQLKVELEKIAQKMNAKASISAWDKIIESQRKCFQKIFQFPDAEICHEIKTVYEPGWGIEDIQKSFEAIKSQVRRPVSVALEREAFRPNAIIINEVELWARQDVWLHMDKPDIEYLLFEKLKRRGLDKSCIKIFSLNPSGHIEFCDELRTWRAPIFFHRNRPSLAYSGFHAENYWTLPTYIEKVYLDLLFKQRKSFRESSVQLAGRERNLIILIRKIIENRTS